MPIPDFDPRGLLPPGDYAVTFEELKESVLVHGTADFPLEGAWRAYLIGQAEVLVEQLWKAGITDIFLDGSFVEAK